MDEITAFISSQPVRKFAKDSILTYQGELPQTLYAIRSGYVKIYDLSSDGNEQFLGLAGKYDFVPSEVLFSGLNAAQFFYASFTPVEAYAVDREMFMGLLRSNNEALYAIVQAVTARYHSLLNHLAAVQKPRAREKIIYVLHYLETYFIEREGLSSVGQQVPLPITQQDIANLVGVTRETAAHELKLLKNEGYVSYNKSQFRINATLGNLIA